MAENETAKIIRLMANELEAKRIIREYRGNDTLLGKLRVMEANRARFETAGQYAELLTASMKAVRTASKKLKAAISAGSSSKTGDRFAKRMDKIMAKFDKQQTQIEEMLDELDIVTGCLDNNNRGLCDSSGDDDDGNDYPGGGGPLDTSSSSLSLCSVPTHSLGDVSVPSSTTSEKPKRDHTLVTKEKAGAVLAEM